MTKYHITGVETFVTFLLLDKLSPGAQSAATLYLWV